MTMIKVLRQVLVSYRIDQSWLGCHKTLLGLFLVFVWQFRPFFGPDKDILGLLWPVLTHFKGFVIFLQCHRRFRSISCLFLSNLLYQDLKWNSPKVPRQVLTLFVWEIGAWPKSHKLRFWRFPMVMIRGPTWNKLSTLLTSTVISFLFCKPPKFHGIITK